MKRIAAILFILASVSLSAQTKKGGISQTVYVPLYSSIFYGDRKDEFDLAATLSIRNINLKNTIIIDSIDYYNSNGKLVRSYLKSSRELKPLESISQMITKSDSVGGSGASFIVKWHSERRVNSPLIESIMIATESQQGISFTSRGVVIEEEK